MQYIFLLGSITSTVQAKFDELWWGASKGLMNIIHLLEEAFKFVVGAGMFTSNDENASMSDLLEQTFTNLFGAEGSMGSLYMKMVLICMGMMTVFFIIGVIRAQFQKDSIESMKKMTGKALWSILKMLVLPVFFFIALHVTGFILNQLVQIMSGDTSTSLAETLCRCFTAEGAGIEWNSNYDDIKQFLEQDKFDFLLCILTSGCLVVTLATATLAVTKRFVKIFFYYVTAPMTLSKSMLDEGKSWELWKDNLLAQLLGAGGVIITMYLFVEVIGPITTIIDDTLNNNHALAAILKIVFILGMSTVPAGSTALMAQLVSQGAGQNESNDLMHTQQMLGNGMRLAGAAAGKVLSGGLAAMAGAGGMGRMLGGGLGGGALSAMGAGGSGSATPSGGAAAATAAKYTMGDRASSAMGRALNLDNRQAKADAAIANRKASGKEGLGLAVMRGGVLGALGYGAARLVGGGLRRVQQGLTHAARAGRDRFYQTSAGRKMLQRNNEARARRDFRAEARGRAAADKAEARRNNVMKKQGSEVNKFLQKDGSAKSGNDNRLNRFYENQFQALNQQSLSLDKELGKSKYGSMNDEEKQNFKNQQLSSTVNKIQSQLNRSKLGQSGSLNERFKRAQAGTLNAKEGGNE